MKNFMIISLSVICGIILTPIFMIIVLGVGVPTYWKNSVWIEGIYIKDENLHIIYYAKCDWKHAPIGETRTFKTIIFPQHLTISLETKKILSNRIFKIPREMRYSTDFVSGDWLYGNDELKDSKKPFFHGYNPNTEKYIQKMGYAFFLPYSPEFHLEQVVNINGDSRLTVCQGDREILSVSSPMLINNPKEIIGYIPDKKTFLYSEKQNSYRYNFNYDTFTPFSDEKYFIFEIPYNSDSILIKKEYNFLNTTYNSSYMFLLQKVDSEILGIGNDEGENFFCGDQKIFSYNKFLKSDYDFKIHKTLFYKGSFYIINDKGIFQWNISENKLTSLYEFKTSKLIPGVRLKFNNQEIKNPYYGNGNI